jgi:hypothetical protein
MFQIGFDVRWFVIIFSLHFVIFYTIKAGKTVPIIIRTKKIKNTANAAKG